MVRKNTLPYVHQWAVLDTETGKIVGEYKTKKSAEEGCKIFNKYGWYKLPDNTDTKDIKDTWKTAYKRMKYPDGDPLPKPPRHSNKRLVELD